MLRAVNRDVLDRLIEAVNDAHREDRGEVFGVPVFLGRGLHARHDLARSVVAAQLDALVAENPGERRQHLVGDAARHQQRLHCVAGAEALGLGVVGDADGLLDVGFVVDIDMAHAVEVLDHRDARFLHDALDQALAAARHENIHILVHVQQFADRRAVGGFDHLHRGCGEPRGCEAFVHACSDRLIGMDRFRAAAQDRGISRFEAQPRSVRCDVGARFVNNRDHAERHAHAADLDARGLLLEFTDLTDGIGQLGDLPQAIGHAGDGFFGESEAVDQRRIEFGIACGVEVLRIGVEQAPDVAPDRLRGKRQRLVLGRGIGSGDEPRSGARLLADTNHVARYVHMREA